MTSRTQLPYPSDVRASSDVRTLDSESYLYVSQSPHSVKARKGRNRETGKDVYNGSRARKPTETSKRRRRPSAPARQTNHSQQNERSRSKKTLQACCNVLREPQPDQKSH